jgi:hypothetical protein
MAERGVAAFDAGAKPGVAKRRQRVARDDRDRHHQEDGREDAV